MNSRETWTSIDVALTQIKTVKTQPIDEITFVLSTDYKLQLDSVIVKSWTNFKGVVTKVWLYHRRLSHHRWQYVQWTGTKWCHWVLWDRKYLFIHPLTLHDSEGKTRLDGFQTFLCLRPTEKSYCSVNSWGELGRDFLKVHLPDWGWGRLVPHLLWSHCTCHTDQLRGRLSHVWFSGQQTFTTGIKWQHERAPSTLSVALGWPIESNCNCPSMGWSLRVDTVPRALSWLRTDGRDWESVTMLLPELCVICFNPDTLMVNAFATWLVFGRQTSILVWRCF